MAGHEIHSSHLFEVPNINNHLEPNFGKSFDGAENKNPYRYGIHYSDKEVILLGGGDEETGLILIGDAMLVDVELSEGKETEILRPYDEEINELIRDSKLH